MATDWRSVPVAIGNFAKRQMVVHVHSQTIEHWAGHVRSRNIRHRLPEIPNGQDLATAVRYSTAQRL